MHEEDDTHVIEAKLGQASDDISGHRSQFSLMKFEVDLLNFLEPFALEFEDGPCVCI